MSILPSTWAFKLKWYPDGSAQKYKARFCVRGDKQVEGMDFWETWSPVVQWSTVRTIMTLFYKARSSYCPSQHHRSLRPHADLKSGEQIFIPQPRGLSHGDNLVLQLNKAVYCLKQTPQYFFQHLTDRLLLCGLKQSNKDPCLFIGKTVIAVVMLMTYCSTPRTKQVSHR